MSEPLPPYSSFSSLRLTDRLQRSNPLPALLRNTVFARWDSVTGPTVCRAWPELAQNGSQFAGDPNLATEPTVLTSELARFIARNCLTAEITNSTSFSNRINSRIFTVPEVGLVAYALVFACIPLKSRSSRSSSMSPLSMSRRSSNATVAFVPQSSEMFLEQMFAWFFLFDAPITRVIEMRTILEESVLTPYIYMLRVALARGLDSASGDSREVLSTLPVPIVELLDSHAVIYEKIFTAFASCILLPAIRFNSTFFAVDMQISFEEALNNVREQDEVSMLSTNDSIEGEDGSPGKEAKHDSSHNNGIGPSLTRTFSWFRGTGAGAGSPVSTSTSNTKEEHSFLRRSIAAFLVSGGRALVLGQSSKSVNALIHTLAIFLPLHCRRLCRLAAARPNEKFIPGFYVQGVVGAPYPSGAELLMSPHALAICNAHDRTICRTPLPSKHRLAASAFLAARIRDAWEGRHNEEMMIDESATPLASISLSDSVPDESIIGDFLVKLAICSPFDNAHRQRFVESAVADFYTRTFCLMQLVERSLEQMAKQGLQNKQQQAKGTIVTRCEMAKLLDLRKPDGDLAILVGLGELLKPGFADTFERCPP